jgi:hypothetical protein
MIRWNMALYAGIGAFVLSFLVGIISGNPFFTILIRALLFGLVFCGLGAAASYLLDKFTPELFNPGQLTQEQNETRGNIDIVLPEENPVISESLIEEQEDSEAAEELETADENRETEQDFLDEEYTGQSDQESPVQEQPADHEDEYVGVISEEMPSSSEPESPEPEGEQEQEMPGMASDSETEVQDVAAAESSPEQPQVSMQQETKDDEIDDLPDMGVLENSFLVLKNEDTGESKTFPEVHSTLGKVDIKKQDPQVYAQAVRTIIKRDEEGPKKYGR